MCDVTLSSLGHTWIFDIDGTICVHNGYKIYGKDRLLPGVAEFFRNLSADDVVVLITSRSDEFKEITEEFLLENNIRYHAIIYNAPYGERILVNDRKPSGLETSIACSLKRDHFDLAYTIDPGK